MSKLNSYLNRVNGKKSFKLPIVEASVEDVKSERVGSIIKKMVERKFNIPVYMQHRTSMINKEGEGIVYGTMFMLGDGKHAFRMNWKTKEQSAHVDSMDFWLHPSIDPQLTSKTSHLNVVEIVNLIDSVLNKGLSGTVNLGETNQPDYQTEEVFQEWEKRPPTGNPRGRPKKTAEVGAAPAEKLVVFEPDEWTDLFDIPLNAKEIFALLQDAIQKVKNGTNKSILITGDPGIGKTFTVKKELKGENIEYFTGAITSASALYKVLFVHNDPDKIIVFDDLDSLLDDRDCVNMLKGALDTGDETEISYISTNTVPPLFYEVIREYEKVEEIPDEIKEQLTHQRIEVDAINEKMWEVYRMRAASPMKANAVMPNKFNFDGRVIFISNKYLSQIPGAIKSRALTVEVSLELEEIVKRIKDVLPHMNIPGASEKHKQQALSFIMDKVVPSKRVKKLDFRTFMDITKFAMSDAPEDIWHRWAAVSIMQKYNIPTAPREKR